jgi:hypothetical protein
LRPIEIRHRRVSWFQNSASPFRAQENGALEEYNSISGFASVADSQDYDLFPVVVIQGDVGPRAEFDHPLAKLRRQIVYKTANLRVLAECFHTLPDCLDGAPGGVPALGSQKLMETGPINTLPGGVRKMRLSPFSPRRGGLLETPFESIEKAIQSGYLLSSLPPQPETP